MARTTMKVAGCQMLVTNSVKANEAKIKAAIRRAADEGADFLLTPEGSLSGYRSSFEGKKVAAAVRRVAARAKRAGVGLLLGTCYKEKAKGRDFCYNQVRVYAPEGEYLGAHSKILRCSPLEMPGTGEMADYVEGTLRAFEWKRITFGVLICNDMWASPHCTTMPNPHLPLQLARMGARIIFHAINSGTDQRELDRRAEALIRDQGAIPRHPYRRGECGQARLGGERPERPGAA